MRVFRKGERTDRGGVQHGQNPRRTAVGEKKAAVGAQNFRTVPFRLCDDALRTGEIVRVGKFGDVPGARFMPRRVKGKVPTLCVRRQHSVNMTLFQRFFIGMKTTHKFSKYYKNE